MNSPVVHYSYYDPYHISPRFNQSKEEDKATHPYVDHQYPNLDKYSYPPPFTASDLNPEFNQTKL